MDSEKKNKGYGLVYQAVMRDKNLSLEAKGIYAYLCSLAGNKGECYPSRQLMLSDLNISQERLDKYIKELMNCKCIEKIRIRESGKFSKNVYKINYTNIKPHTEKPHTEKPYTEKPYTEKPYTEKPDTNNNNLNNNSLNNNSLNNNSLNNKKLYSSNEEYNQKGKPFCTGTETVRNESGDAETAQSNTLTDTKMLNTETVQNTEFSESIKAERKRYNAEQLKIIDDFFDVLKYTRKGGKIAKSVVLKIYRSWNKYEVQKVIFGLTKYINNPALHDKPESYVLGIIRNTTAEEINRKSKNGIETYNQFGKKITGNIFFDMLGVTNNESQ